MQFASCNCITVVPVRVAMLYSVSPACTKYIGQSVRGTQLGIVGASVNWEAVGVTEFASWVLTGCAGRLRINRRCPTAITPLEGGMQFASWISATVIPARVAILKSVSPAWTM